MTKSHFLVLLTSIFQSVSGSYHIINSAKLWLRRHGAVAAEVPVYVSHLRELFHSESENDYRSQLEVLKLDWSQAFVNYYEREVHDKVRTIVDFCV